jgi:transcriptional regulator with XRE-family HTH domain
MLRALVSGGSDVADLQQTLGAVIRSERRRRRRTMKWLAEKAALSLVYLGEIERGKKYPSAQVLERLAWALELPLPALLESVAAALVVPMQPARLDAIGRQQPVDLTATPRTGLTAMLGRAA